MMHEEINLSDYVIALHDIARNIEQHIGKGQLSEDIRKTADRLQEVINNVAL